MIQSSRYLNAANPIRPYKYHFNCQGLYDTAIDTKLVEDELTDEDIDYLIKSDSTTFGGIVGSDFDIKANLHGDDYADAMMSELGF